MEVLSIVLLKSVRGFIFGSEPVELDGSLWRLQRNGLRYTRSIQFKKTAKTVRGYAIYRKVGDRIQILFYQTFRTD